MNKGQIVKLKENIAFTTHKKEDLGIIKEINDKNVKVLFIDCTEATIPEALLSNTRNIPIEIKNAFKDLLMYAKKIDKINEVIKVYQEQIKEYKNIQNNTFIDMKNKLAEYSNEYTEEDLIELCKKNFPNLNNNNFSFEFHNNRIVISKDVSIVKYFRESSFIYEEYDGTIQMFSDCEKDPNYQRYLKENSNKISNCKLPCQEYLGLGDKDMLYCMTNYILEFKNLNKDTVEKTISKYIDKPLKKLDSLDNNEMSR